MATSSTEGQMYATYLAEHLRILMIRSTQANQISSPLLRLPDELRNRIHKFTFNGVEVRIRSESRYLRSLTPLEVAKARKGIRMMRIYSIAKHCRC
jgi:hypothetical protein